jgi:hypothetical protein
METSEEIIGWLISMVSEQTSERDLLLYKEVLHRLVQAARAEQLASINNDFESLNMILREHNCR